MFSCSGLIFPKLPTGLFICLTHSTNMPLQHQPTRNTCRYHASQWRTWFSSIPKIDWECLLQKFKSVFAQPISAAYFHSISENLGSKEHHLKWINSIRATIWPYTQRRKMNYHPQFPSIPLEKICVDSKHLAGGKHWKTQWSLWLSGDTINVVWESDHNVHQARERVQFYTKGCKCKTNCSRGCGCVRHHRPCGPGCIC